MVYKQYTLNGTRGVPFGWRCPGCKKLNIGAHKVKASASYDDRGFRVNLDSRKEKAKEQMDAALEKVALKAIYNTENRRFDKLNFTDKCAQCGEVPPWSDLPVTLPKWLTTVRGLCLAAAIILAIITAMSKSPRQNEMYLSAGVFAALFVVILLAGWIKKRKALSDAMPDIEKLPPESLPHMALNGPELLLRLKQDGLLSVEEARELGVSTNDWTNTISANYRARAEQYKKDQRKKAIIIAVIVAIAVAIFGYTQYNGSQFSQWQAVMDSANLLAADPGAGSAYIVQEKRGSAAPKYSKNYLEPEIAASKPEDVGYVIIITDTDEKVGSYGVINKPAYRVHTTLRLFDRHTGEYVGSSIELVGGKPPSSIKSTSSVGRGSRPTGTEIKKAISQLMARVKK